MDIWKVLVLKWRQCLQKYFKNSILHYFIQSLRVTKMHIPWIFCACFLIWMGKECHSNKFYLLKTKGAKSTDQHLETSAEEVSNYETETDEEYLDDDLKSQEHEYEEPKPKRRKGKGSRNKSTMHTRPDGTHYFTTDWEARGLERPEGAPP